MGRTGSKAVWGAALALWFVMPTASALASGGPGKVDKFLRDGSSSGRSQRVIVRYREGANERVKSKLPKSGRGPTEHKLISAFATELDGRGIAALANDPDVLSISADADVTASADKTASATSANSSGSDAVSLVKQTLGLENWFSGSTSTIAVIDSGVQSNTDLSGRILGSYDFTGGKLGIPTAAIDEYGHGTHVAGLIGSSGASSSGKYAGVVPGVKILALKVLDKKGLGKTSDVIAALQFAVANKDLLGIKIVNLSLGHPIFEPAATDPLVQAVEAASRAGLIVVAAAGNFGTNPTTGLVGYGGITSPGNAPSAITVGAASNAGTTVRTDDRIASFSSRGPSWYDGIAKPDVVGPGTGMVSNAVLGSTLVTDFSALTIREGASTYLRLNGSSMATAVVSGLVAVMLEANNYAAQQRWDAAQSYLLRKDRLPFTGAPRLSANAIKAMLQYSATPLRDANGVKYDALTQGSGLVDGHGAIVLAYYTDTTKPTGSFWMTTTYPPSTVFGGVVETWSQTVIWGTRLVQGSSLIDYNQQAWSNNIVWGTGEFDNIVWGTSVDGDNIVWGTTVDGDNIVWGTSVFWSGNASFGDNIVWGTNLAWGDNIVWGTNLIGFFNGDNIVWGTTDDDNIVWGTLDDDNIVWGTSTNKVTVLGTSIGGGL